MTVRNLFKVINSICDEYLLNDDDVKLVFSLHSRILISSIHTSAAAGGGVHIKTPASCSGLQCPFLSL